MKLKLVEIHSVFESLKKVLDKDLPIKVAYRVSKAFSSIQAEESRIEDMRLRLVKKYCSDEDKEKTDKSIMVDSSNVEEFKKEFFGFLEEEIDLDISDDFKIDVDELEGIKISTIDLMNLSKIINFK